MSAIISLGKLNTRGEKKYFPFSFLLFNVLYLQHKKFSTALFYMLQRFGLQYMKGGPFTLVWAVRQNVNRPLLFGMSPRPLLDTHPGQEKLKTAALFLLGIGFIFRWKS